MNGNIDIEVFVKMLGNIAIEIYDKTFIKMWVIHVLTQSVRERERERERERKIERERCIKVYVRKG